MFQLFLSWKLAMFDHVSSGLSQADRREGLIAERTALATVEDRNVKKRKTAAALRTELVEIEAKNVLLKDLDKERRRLTAKLKGRALKVCKEYSVSPLYLSIT
jgi:hypothetical protein